MSREVTNFNKKNTQAPVYCLSVCHKTRTQLSQDWRNILEGKYFCGIFAKKSSLKFFIGLGLRAKNNPLFKYLGVMKTSALRRWPSTTEALTFSTGRRRPLTFSTGRRRPDWAFLLVDVDHWAILVDVGRRPSTAIFTDVFITPKYLSFLTKN